MSWYLTFNEDLPNWATYFAGFVSPVEPSSLRLTGPFADRVEIGEYSYVLPPERAEAYRRVVEGTGYPALVTHETVVPETPSLTLGKGVLGVDPLPKLYGFPLPTMSPALIPAREAVHQLARELLDHPLHVIRAEAQWTAPSFKPRGTLEAVLTLKNPGLGPVELRSPDAPDDPSRIILTVGSATREGEVEQVELGLPDVVRVDASGKKQAPSEWVALAPGEEARFLLKKKVYLGTGSYRGTVTLRALEPDGQPRSCAYGVLLAKAGGFDVKGWW